MGPISDWQRNMADISSSMPSRPWAPVNTPPSVPAADPQPAGDVDQFSQAAARDAASQPSAAAATGARARAVVQAPLVAAASALPDLRDAANTTGRAVKAAGGAISDFAKGFTGSASTTAPTSPSTTAAGDDVQADIARANAANPPPAATTPATSSSPAVAEGTAQPQAAQQDAADEARPSNVRAYIRRTMTPTTAPTVDPEAFARNYTAMRQAAPGSSIGQAIDAHVLADAYKSSYLAALGKAQEGYSGETNRITALSSASRANTESQEGAARTEDIGQNIITKRYSLEQQKNLQDLTKKLQDPNLSDKDRRDLEQQLWILHGKPPRPDTRYKAIPGHFNPATGQYEPTMVIDSTTGAVKPAGGQPAAGAAPQGMRQVGTSNGVPVFEDANGKRFTSQ